MRRFSENIGPRAHEIFSAAPISLDLKCRWRPLNQCIYSHIWFEKKNRPENFALPSSVKGHHRVPSSSAKWDGPEVWFISLVQASEEKLRELSFPAVVLERVKVK
jgi:hypothetical protein